MANAEWWSTESQGHGWCAKAWNPYGYSYFRLTWGALAAELGYKVPEECQGSDVAVFDTQTKAEQVADAWETREVS